MQSMATISGDLFAATVLIYSLAMFGFAAEFAFGRRGAVHSRSVAAPVPEPALVGAAVGGPVAAAGGAAGPAGRSVVVAGGRLPAGPTPAADGPAAGASDAGPAGRPVAERLGRAALVVTGLGWAVHVAEVVTRGLAAHRVPWGNMYEFSSAAALVAVTGFLLLAVRHRLRHLGVFVLLPVVLYLGLAGTVLYVPAGPLVPALHSYGIKVHVVAALTATGTFLIGGVVSLLHLLRRRYDAASAAGRRPGPSAVGRRLPSAAVLDRVEYRVIAFAFPIWTFAIIAGAIWAESAWGRYWGWDPKETWSFITWLVYAAYLHARSISRFRRYAPAMALLGFLALTVNYYIINIFISGLHSYAGVR